MSDQGGKKKIVSWSQIKLLKKDVYALWQVLQTFSMWTALNCIDKT